MSAGDAFDEWARQGKDQGMEERHWHTAKHVLSQMPVEEGDTVLDLGSGVATPGVPSGRPAAPDGRSASTPPLRWCTTPGPTPRTGTRDSCVATSNTSPSPTARSTTASRWRRSTTPRTPRRPRRVAAGAAARRDVLLRRQPLGGERLLPRVVGTRRRADDPLERAREYREAFREAGFHVAGQGRIPDEGDQDPARGDFPSDDWGDPGVDGRALSRVRDAANRRRRPLTRYIGRFRTRGRLLVAGTNSSACQPASKCSSASPWRRAC